MPRKPKTTEQFIKDAIKIHKNKYDYSKVNGRVVGQLPDGTPIIGSKSMRVTPLTIDDRCPLELKTIRDNQYLSDAPNKFKEVLNKTCYNSVWGNETNRELINVRVKFSNVIRYGYRI